MVSMTVYLVTGCHSANYCIGFFVLHPRLHPTPHAALEFIFLTTDSTLGGYSIAPDHTRLIHSATPSHSTHPLGYSPTLAHLLDIQ